MKRQYTILINEQSGAALKMGREALEDRVQASGLDVRALHILPPDQFIEKIKEGDGGVGPYGALLIGGGDGTIRSCAESLMETGCPFGILPLGTMNLMARDLDIPLGFDEALAAYANGAQEKLIDVGTVNGAPFLCGVGLGTMPESAEFREESRDQTPSLLLPRLTVFVLGEMDRRRHRRVRLTIDGKTRWVRTAALVVANNEYGSTEEWTAHHFKRQSLCGGKLGVYSAAPSSLWARLRFLLRLGLGGWKKDPAIHEWKGREVDLDTARPSELLSLDGETLTMQMPLTVRMKPASLSVLVPDARAQREAA